MAFRHWMPTATDMQIIFIKENQKEKWDEFIASNPDGSFLQSWAWGDFQEAFGRKVWRLAMMENNEIVSAALIIKQGLPFGWNYFYCPRGIISQKLIELFFEEVKKLAEKEKVVFLRIDPVVYNCHSRNKFGTSSELQQCHPELVSGSTGSNRFRNKFGMTKDKFEVTKENKFATTKKTKPTQPQYTLILDITKSEEEILTQMKQKTRYNIRLAGRKGVRIKKISQPNDQEIQTFLNLSVQTSERDKFQIHPKKYYQKMLEILCENSTAELFFAEYRNEIIAANIVVFFSGKAVYLHGASSNIHREAMAPYLLHWEQIKEAKKLGCLSYDFWGIEKQLKVKSKKLKVENETHCHSRNEFGTGSELVSGSNRFRNKFGMTKGKFGIAEKNNWTGITRFKKGFGGEEISYPESRDIILKPISYVIYRIARKIL